MVKNASKSEAVMKLRKLKALKRERLLRFQKGKIISIITCMQRARIDNIDLRLHENSVASLRRRRWLVAHPFAKDVVEFVIAEHRV